MTITICIALNFILRCATPIDPDAAQTSVAIILDSPTLQQSGDFLEDSLGNTIRLGVACFLPEHLDSVQLLITSPTGESFVDTMFRPQSTLLYDTLWMTVLLRTPGAKNIIVYPFSDLELTPARATLFVYNRELPENGAPRISILGNTVVRPGRTCMLIVKGEDADRGQTVSLNLEKSPEGSLLLNDTLFTWNIPDDHTGTDTIIVSATDNGIPNAMSFDTVIITVTRNPHPPTQTISGDRTLKPASNCILVIANADADTDQSVTTTVSGNPDGSSIIDGNVFMWQIPAGFTGKDTLYFTATDNGIPPREIVDTVIIVVSEDDVNFPPVWTKDTLDVAITDDGVVDIDLTEFCKDADGDDLSFSLEDSAPETGLLEGTRYRFTPAKGSNASFIVGVLAKDQGSTTVRAVIKVAVILRVVDNTAPRIAMLSPILDSVSINSPTAVVSFSVVDESGIDTIVCTMDGKSFGIAAVDTYFTAIVSGLAKDVYNRIMITASDASDRHNSYSKILYIKYDPTMEDRTSPVIERIVPAFDSVVVKDSSMIVTIVATDVSGIVSVTGTMGDTLLEFGRTDSLYSFQVNGLAKNRYRRIVVVATDSSVNKNSDSAIFYVKYDPTLDDVTPPLLARVSPVKDSSVVPEVFLPIEIAVTDENGISLVSCSMNGRTIPVTNNGSMYSATVDGLVPEQYNQIVFTAVDASTQQNRSLLVYHVYSDTTMNDHANPELVRLTPDKDTVLLSIPAVQLSVAATDVSGIRQVICSKDGIMLPVSASGTRYSATVIDLVKDVFTRIVFVATDKSSNSNSDSIVYHVKYDPTLTDTEKPAVNRAVPTTETFTTATSSLVLSVYAFDGSGIASVTCTMDQASFEVFNNGSAYSAEVSGLKENGINLITFTVTDASSNKNETSVSFRITYDPSLSDKAPPVFTITNWPADDAVLREATKVLAFKVIDPSGIDSVWWNLNGVFQARLSPVAPDGYSFVAPLSHTDSNRIVVYATDNSSNHNRDSLVRTLYYNQQPVAHSQRNLETKRNTALAVTLTASDPDYDAITQWKITQYPVNGSITIPTALPQIIYAPNLNVVGMDSIKFRVWDARDSSVTPGVIVINVKNDDVAPKFLLEPVNSAGDSGATLTFTSQINSDVYPAPAYTWKKVTGEIVATTGPNFTISSLKYGNQGDYLLEVSNRAGLITSKVFTLLVYDRTPPVVKLIGSGDTTVQLYEDWSDPGARAYDDRDGDLTDKIIVNGTVNTQVPGIYKIANTARDVQGNGATFTRTVRVEGWEKIANFESLDFTSIMTADNKYYVFYVSNTEQGRVSTFNEEGTFVQVGKDFGNISALSIALGNDQVTPFISFYNPSNAHVTIMKLVDGSWEPVIDQMLPIWYENSSTLSLTLGARDVPHVASKFQDGNYSNCGVYNIYTNEWRVVGEPKAFDGIINNSELYRDRNLVLVTAAQNTPYVAGTANIIGGRPRPICKKLDNGEWVSAAKDSLIGTENLTSPNNIHLLRNARDEIYFGCTFGEGTSDPRVFQLKGDVWSQLPPIARNSDIGGGSFSMAMGSDDRLYVVHPENDDMIVKRWNGLEWRCIPDFNTNEQKPAFIAPNGGVSVAAGKDECYVTYRHGSVEDQTTIIMHWKKP